jgi:O-antigen ligase
MIARLSSASLPQSMTDTVRAWQTMTPLARALFICLAGGFLIASMPAWALLFYFGVVPFCGLRLWRDRSLDWCSSYAAVALLLIVWSSMTLLWGQNPGGNRIWHFLLGSACTLVFLIAALIVLGEDQRSTRALGSIMICCGAVNAAISIALFVGPDMLDRRLQGWGETRQAILGASIIGNCLVFTLSRLLSERRQRWLLIVVAVLLFGFIVLTGSRGPLIAVVAASVVLVVGRPWRWLLRAALLLGLVAAAIYLLAPGTTHHLASDLGQRGMSYRPEIWRYTLARIAERPWFGWGLAAYLGLEKFPFPHSLYLSSLFYSGIIGFALLMTLIGAITVGLLRKPDVAERRLLLALWVNALLSGLTDLGQVSNGPGPLWYIFWLPAVLGMSALAVPTGTHRSINPPRRTALEPAAPGNAAAS